MAACQAFFILMCLGFLPLGLWVYTIPGLPGPVRILISCVVVGVLWWGPYGYSMYLKQAVEKGDRGVLKRGLRGTAYVVGAKRTGFHERWGYTLETSAPYGWRYHLLVTPAMGRPYKTYVMVSTHIPQGTTVDVAISQRNKKRVAIDLGQGETGKLPLSFDGRHQSGTRDSRHTSYGVKGAKPQARQTRGLEERGRPVPRPEPEDTPPPGYVMGHATHAKDRSVRAESRENEMRMRQLAELGRLHKEGVLTDAEFAAEKARILGH